MIDEFKVTFFKRVMMIVGIIIIFLIGLGFGSMSKKTDNQSSSHTTLTKKVKVNSIIVAKNMKVKKSKKVTKIKVSLKKVNGKYLKSKTLKILFKGKTYKVKTNKKGTATWKVKKSMVKKLKVVKKYKYKVTYGKDASTKKITIKK